MKKLSTLLSIPFVLLSFAVFSQASLVDVSVTNNQFSPQQVNIMVGDTVRWTNGQGIHNINGSLMSYPENPEPFGIAPPSSDWVYTHVFTLPGVYNYHCDPHLGMGMTGIVVVDNVTTVGKSSNDGSSVSIYPNPATDIVMFDLRNVPSDVLTEAELVIYSTTGKRQEQLALYNADQLEVNVTDFPAGLYLFQLIARDGDVIHSGKLLVR